MITPGCEATFGSRKAKTYRAALPRSSNIHWVRPASDDFLADHSVLVPDAAGVERIGQQAVEVSATERQPACPGSIRGEVLPPSSAGGRRVTRSRARV